MSIQAIDLCKTNMIELLATELYLALKPFDQIFNQIKDAPYNMA